MTAPTPATAARHSAEYAPCFYCGELCNDLAGDPGLWSLYFPDPDQYGSGYGRHHHTKCVMRRLDDLSSAAVERDRLKATNRELLAALRELSAMYTHAWDLVDGGLTMLSGSVDRFEAAHENARAAISRATTE